MKKPSWQPALQRFARRLMMSKWRAANNPEAEQCLSASAKVHNYTSASTRHKLSKVGSTSSGLQCQEKWFAELPYLRRHLNPVVRYPNNSNINLVSHPSYRISRGSWSFASIKSPDRLASRSNADTYRSLNMSSESH